MLAAIVPVKRLAAAKSRLAHILSAAERRTLVLTMLSDVLAALMATRGIDRIGVISADPAVLALAHARGVEPLRDQSADLNAALGQAGRHYATAGAQATLVLPADLPLATPRALAAVIAGEAGAVIVPSRDGGTNALLLRPPLALPYQFGPASMARHSAAAHARGIVLCELNDPALQLDVDRANDLLLLAEAAGATATQALLRELAVSERVMCA